MVERKIVFYRWRSVSSRREFVPYDCAIALDSLIANSPERSILDSDGITTAATDVEYTNGESVVRLCLLALRTPENRPSSWHPGGVLTSLPLGKGHYPADVTHVVIWPNGIAAQDIGSNSPRLGRLSYYLRKLIRASVSFSPLYNPDTYQKLENIRGQLRGCEFAVTRQEFEDLNRGTFGSLVPGVYGPKVPSIRVRMGMGRYGPRDRYLDREVEESVMQLADNASSLVDQLSISGKSRVTGNVETVNLLSERLQRSVDLPAEPTIPSLPSMSHVFREIEDSHAEFEEAGVFNRATEIEQRRG